MLAALLAAVLAQPVAADLRTARVLGREDTRTQTRTWVLGHLPAGTQAVVEPAFPPGFFGTHLAQGFAAPPNPPGHHRGTPARFIRTLGAPRVDRYRAAGFCTVVTSSFIRDRALAAGTAPARRYYRRLDRESVVLFRASPYRAGAGPRALRLRRLDGPLPRARPTSGPARSSRSAACAAARHDPPRAARARAPSRSSPSRASSSPSG